MVGGITINMKSIFESISESCDRSLSDLTRFRSVLSDSLLFRTFWADLSCHFLQEMSANHPQIAQRKQRLQSRSVLGQTTVPNLREAELTLDDSKRMLNLRPNSGFDSLCCVAQLPRGRFQVQRSALARHHRNVPIHLKILCLFAFFYTAIARICEYVGLLAVKQILSLGNVMDISGCRHQGVDQSGFGIDANVGLNPKVVLISLLRLVHLRIARTAIILGRTGRRDQRRIDRRTAFEQKSLGLEDCVYFGQYDLGQAKLLEKMPKPQYRRFVWQAGGAGIQASKPTIDRHVVQSLFHRRIGIIVPKLQEMNTQHRFNGKRRSTRLRHRGITLNNPNERGPRNHGVHLLEKDPLAGPLGCDFEAAIGKGSLFHASILSSHGLERPSFADFP